MVAGTVFTYEERPDFRSVKVLVTAKLSGKELERKRVGSQANGLSRIDFAKAFPFGRIPGLQISGSGTQLEESNAAAYFLASDELRGGESEEQRALVLQWMK